MYIYTHTCMHTCIYGCNVCMHVYVHHRVELGCMSEASEMLSGGVQMEIVVYNYVSFDARASVYMSFEAQA